MMEGGMQQKAVLDAFGRAITAGEAWGRPWEEIAAIRIITDDAGGTKRVGEIVAILQEFRPKFEKLDIGTRKS
jgi:hypothetical protein